MKALNGVVTLGEQYTDTREKIITDIKQGNLQAKKRIAGIPCPDELTTGEMLSFFTKENLHIAQLKEKLQKAGLPFKAIVPTEFYNRIKKEKKVYIFKNIDEDGFTSFSKSDTRECIEDTVAKFEKFLQVTATALKIICTVAFFALGIWAIHYCFIAYTWEPGAFWTCLVIFFIAGGIFYGVSYDSFTSRKIDSLSEYLIAPILKKSVMSGVVSRNCKLFWPNYNDSFENSPKIKVNFITPPKRIIDSVLLWKQAGYKVHISAQKEAFTLDISGIQDFIHSTMIGAQDKINHQKELELQARIETRRRFLAQFHDPITSIEDGEFTVLIDAYGSKSFVSEREVVDSVKGYYNSRLQQFQTVLN